MMRKFVMLLLLWAFVGGASYAALALGGRSLWFVCGCLLFLAVVGTASALFLTGPLRVTRRIATSTALRDGDVLTVEGVLELPTRFPLVWVVVSDEWRHAQTGRRLRGSALLLPLGKRLVPFRYTLPNLPRGEYTLVRHEAATSDFLHLSGSRYRENADGEAIRYFVYPQPIRQSSAGGPVRPVTPDSATVGGVRAYAEGDSLRQVDWKSYLRRGRLMTRLPDSDDASSVVLLLDPGANDEQFERAVGAAAGWLEERRQPPSDLNIICGTDSHRVSGDHAGLDILAKVRRPTALSLALTIDRHRTAIRSDTETIVATGRLDVDVLRAVRDTGRVTALSLLYASAKPVLSTPERAVMSELQAIGCEFGFAPHRADWAPRPGAPAYG